MKAYMTVQQVVLPEEIVAQAAAHDLWLQHLNDLERWPTYAFLGSEASVTDFLREVYDIAMPAEEIMEIDLDDGMPYVLSTGEPPDPSPQGKFLAQTRPGRIRVLRLLEYTYDDPEWMAEDMLRWTSGQKLKGFEMRSATLQPEWVEGDAKP